MIHQERGEERGQSSNSWTQREQQHPAHTIAVLWSLLVIRLTGV